MVSFFQRPILEFGDMRNRRCLVFMALPRICLYQPFLKTSCTTLIFHLIIFQSSNIKLCNLLICIVLRNVSSPWHLQQCWLDSQFKWYEWNHFSLSKKLNENISRSNYEWSLKILTISKCLIVCHFRSITFSCQSFSNNMKCLSPRIYLGSLKQMTLSNLITPCKLVRYGTSRKYCWNKMGIWSLYHLLSATFCNKISLLLLWN